MTKISTIEFINKEISRMVGKRIRAGDIYQDCNHHPCVANVASIQDDEFEGISLIDGSGPRCCSYRHCGPIKMTIKQAMLLVNNWKEYAAPIEKWMKENGHWKKKYDYLKTDWGAVRNALFENGFAYKIKILERYLKR